MPDFNAFLLFAAQIGAALFALVLILRWFVTPYLWFCHDKPIQDLVKKIEDSKKKLMTGASGRGITTDVLARQIASMEKPILEELESRKLKRQHFLDRINLFLSVSSLGK